MINPIYRHGPSLLPHDCHRIRLAQRLFDHWIGVFYFHAIYRFNKQFIFHDLGYNTSRSSDPYISYYQSKNLYLIGLFPIPMNSIRPINDILEEPLGLLIWSMGWLFCSCYARLPLHTARTKTLVDHSCSSSYFISKFLFINLFKIYVIWIKWGKDQMDYLQKLLVEDLGDLSSFRKRIIYLKEHL